MQGGFIVSRKILLMIVECHIDNIFLMYNDYKCKD